MSDKLTQWLDAVEARTANATPGPWEVVNTATPSTFTNHWREIGVAGRGFGTVVGSSSYHSSRYGEVSGVRIMDGDAAFIAESRSDVPRLLRLVRALMAYDKQNYKHVGACSCRECSARSGELSAVIAEIEETL
jgi:hypothetical protein